MSKDRVVSNRSSYLVSIPVAIISFILCIISVFAGQMGLAAVFMLFVLMGIVSRIWAKQSLKNLSVRVLSKSNGMFAGETTEMEVEINNDKAMPVVWMQVYFPIAPNLCMIPQDSRVPEQWEVYDLELSGGSRELVGDRKFSFIKWYETKKFTMKWTGNCRGIYTADAWKLRTGDGFGLVQVERIIRNAKIKQFAIYPKLIDVKNEMFLKNLWNADTGARGVMEDTTVIRSTRDYMLTDSLKRINWRLAARQLPLAVNVYEEILPKSVHFIFDGESFSGSMLHKEEMEEAFSILTSELISLEAEQVRCAISLPKGDGNEAINVFHSDGIDLMLHAISAYNNEKIKVDVDNDYVYIPQESVFDEAPILSAKKKTGHFYYITYDADTLTNRALIQTLDHQTVSILTYCDSKPIGEFETICMQSLKEACANV